MTRKQLVEGEELLFFEVLKRRHSMRSYTDRVVEDWILERILEASNSAPSAGNLQAYEIFVIRERKKKRALVRAAYFQDFIEEAPIVLVFCAEPARSSWRYGSRGEQLFCIQDATIAAAYAQLAATALGLGSVWVGAFDEEKVSGVLGPNSGLRPVTIMPIGYPAEKPEPRSRRRLEELVHPV